MAWSTQQLADLAGVTLRSIRHWHEIGLLPQPERRSNGYKQYTARHLVLALRIHRLASLGFSLDQVAEMLDSGQHGRESLQGFRAELDDRIAELTRIRSEIDELLATGVSPDLSPEALLAFEALGDGPGSRNVAILLARLLPKADMPSFAAVMKTIPESLSRLDAELRDLPPDAEEARIEELADRGAELMQEFIDHHGDAFPSFDVRISDDDGTDAMATLMYEQMNVAQQRAMALMIERLRAE